MDLLSWVHTEVEAEIVTPVDTLHLLLKGSPKSDNKAMSRGEVYTFHIDRKGSIDLLQKVCSFQTKQSFSAQISIISVLQ